MPSTTTTPATAASSQPTVRNRAGTAGRGCPGANQVITSQVDSHTSAAENRKCEPTNAGCRSSTTVRPPSTACTSDSSNGVVANQSSRVEGRSEERRVGKGGRDRLEE